MSFSGKVKEELSLKIASARHCQMAELAALIGMCGSVCITAGNRFRLRIRTENQTVARKCFTLLKKTYNIDSDVSVRRRRRSDRESLIYTVYVGDHSDTERVLQALRLLDENGDVVEQVSPANQLLVQMSCCRRAFIRGAFLAAGSISDPSRFYHFEIACSSRERAEQLSALIAPFGPQPRVVPRRNHWIVYIKEGSQIVDMLNIMEAHNSLMDLENIRIVRDVRNSVNRMVNCEAANINKTVNAAVKQVEDIRFLDKAVGLGNLPPGLADIARVRLDYPDATLKELGMMLDPPVGKSGVNHRLRKLSQMAAERGQNKEESYYD